MSTQLSAAATIAFISALAGPGDLHKCAFEGGRIFPSIRDELPVSGRLVIESHGMMGPEGFREDVAFELRSASEAVPLRIAERYGSAEAGSEIVLSAIRALRLGTRYALYVDGKLANPIDYDVHGGDVAWTTEVKPDRSAPRWRSRPRVTTDRVAGALHIEVPADDESPVQILIDVQPLGYAMPIGEGQKSSYLLWIEGGTVSLDLGPCGGAVRLKPGATYSIALTAVDASGNQSPAPGGRLKLVVPDRQAHRRP
jgi:hypothetical protein